MSSIDKYIDHLASYKEVYGSKTVLDDLWVIIGLMGVVLVVGLVFIFSTSNLFSALDNKNAPRWKRLLTLTVVVVGVLGTIFFMWVAIELGNTTYNRAEFYKTTSMYQQDVIEDYIQSSLGGENIRVEGVLNNAPDKGIDLAYKSYGVLEKVSFRYDDTVYKDTLVYTVWDSAYEDKTIMELDLYELQKELVVKLDKHGIDTTQDGFKELTDVKKFVLGVSGKDNQEYTLGDLAYLYNMQETKAD